MHRSHHNAYEARENKSEVRIKRIGYQECAVMHLTFEK